LSLRRLPGLVGRTDQYFQPVVSGFGACDARRRRNQDLQQNRGLIPKILQPVWRPYHDRPSWNEARRRLRALAARVHSSANSACPLREQIRFGKRRPPEIQRLAVTIWRYGRNAG